jgi:hypothetical protein
MLHCGRCASKATLALAKVEKRADVRACSDFKIAGDFLFSGAQA